MCIMKYFVFQCSKCKKVFTPTGSGVLYESDRFSSSMMHLICDECGFGFIKEWTVKDAAFKQNKIGGLLYDLVDITFADGRVEKDIRYDVCNGLIRFVNTDMPDIVVGQLNSKKEMLSNEETI